MSLLLHHCARSRETAAPRGRAALSGFVLVLMSALAAPGYGQATLFTDRQSFDAAVPNRTAIDFNTILPFETASVVFSLPPVLNLSGLTFQRFPFNPGGNDLSVLTPSVGTPYQGWNGNPVVFQYVGLPNSTMVITLPPGTLDVGMNFYTVQTNSGPGPVNVFTGNLQIALSTGQTFIIPSLDKPNLAFVGFISTTPITSITVFPPLASTTALAGGDVALTNLELSTGPPPTIACPASTGILGGAYASSFTPSGGALPYLFVGLTSGALPSGLAIDSSGNITGTPTAPGTFTFSGGVTDSFRQAATANCSIVISPPPPITLSAVPVASSNGTQVLLTWTFSDGAIDGFVVQRKPPTLSDVFQPLAPQTGSVASGPQACPAPSYVSGLLVPQSRCLIDTLPVAGATFIYQVEVSAGGVLNAMPPSNTAAVYQVRKNWGTEMDATFTPAASHSLHEAAVTLGFDHFNWISILTHDPQCYINAPSSQLHAYDMNAPSGSTPGPGLAQLAPHFDPPFGGYVEYGFSPPTTNIGPSDGQLYYWDEQSQWFLNPTVSLNPAFNLFGAAAGGAQSSSDTAAFKDLPFHPCLPGSASAAPTEYWGFITSLVGVRNPVGNNSGVIGGSQAVNFTPLASFAWNTTYNASAGGANGARSLNLTAPQIPGTGGVFNVTDLATQDLPLNIRQMLIQAGGQGILSTSSADTHAPVTAAFLSGPQSANGSYTGPVTVTLIATDIDGPTDVVSTSYSLDGGSTLSYSSPFLVSTLGPHTIVFGSIDQAQNVETPKPSVSFTIVTPAQLLRISSPATLPAGTVGTPYGAVQLSATGGTGLGRTWTETGSLPLGMTFISTGLLSGVPLVGTQGTYNLQFKVTDSAANSATVSLALTVNLPPPPGPPPSITSISPTPVPTALALQTIFINGTGFRSGTGLTVRLFNGNFETDVTGSQLTLFSSTQLAVRADLGSVTANWTATVVNPDTQVSNVFAFTVQAPQVTTFALPQFVFGGAWYTALYFTNTTDLPLSVAVKFLGDDGLALSVPLVGIGTVSSQTVIVSPKSTVVLEALNGTGISVEGWVETSLPTGVLGYALLRQVVVGRPDQEAVVPLTPETSQTADLIYDDMLFTTAVAFLNPSNQSVPVNISVFGPDGVQVGSSQILLAPRSKRATVLKSVEGLGGIAGNRGRAVFSVSSGAVSVLGLRFGGSAFTSIPVVHRPAVAETRTISFSLPQFVFGGAWYTALYLSNTTSAPISVPVNFVDDNGAPLTPSLLGIAPATSQTVLLPPGATTVLEAPAGTGTTVDGWVNVALPPGVTGYAVFRQTVAGRPDQEAVVPLTSESSLTADLIYDDILFTTAVALLNPSSQQTVATITVYSANGAQIGSVQVPLAAHAKIAPTLKSVPGLSSVSGNRGWATFSVPNGDISVLGLRFGGSAFTSIPVTHR